MNGKGEGDRVPVPSKKMELAFPSAAPDEIISMGHMFRVPNPSDIVQIGIKTLHTLQAKEPQEGIRRFEEYMGLATLLFRVEQSLTSAETIRAKAQKILAQASPALRESFQARMQMMEADLLFTKALKDLKEAERQSQKIQHPAAE